MLLLDEYAEFSGTSFKSGIPCAGPELGWFCRMCPCLWAWCWCAADPLLGALVGTGLLYPGGGTVPSRAGDSRAEIPVAQVIIFQQIRAEEGSGSGLMCLQASLVLVLCK